MIALNVARVVLKMLETQISQAIREVISREVPKVLSEVSFLFYPKNIKGHLIAANLLGLSYRAFTKRLEAGYYCEGIHYEKISDKIFVWDRDALLDSEKSKGSKK